MNLKNILKDVFLGAMAVGVSVIYLNEMSSREIDMTNINNHAAELDSAQAAYGSLVKRSEAGTLHDANIDSTRTSQLREKYGDKIGANDIIVAEEQALSRKELESLIMPFYDENYFNTITQPKEFDFRKELMEKALDTLGYTLRDILYRLPDGSQELEPITIPGELKQIEIK